MIYQHLANLKEIIFKINKMSKYVELIAFIKDQYKTYSCYIAKDSIIVKVSKCQCYDDLSVGEYDNIKFLLFALSYPDEFVDVLEYKCKQFTENECKTPYQVHLKLKEICGCVIDLRYLTIAMHHNNVYNNEAIEEFFELAKEKNVLIRILYQFYNITGDLFTKTDSIGYAMYDNWNMKIFDRLEQHPLITAHKARIYSDVCESTLKMIELDNKVVDIYLLLSFGAEQNKTRFQLYKYAIEARDKSKCATMVNLDKEKIASLEKELAELKASTKSHEHAISIIKAEVELKPDAFREIVQEIINWH